MTVTTSAGLGFTDLVFSDLRRYRPGERATWRGVVKRCLSNPGMLASVILRAQQIAMRRGQTRVAFALRTLGLVLVSADFVPGMEVGPGLMMPHPNGIVIGNGLVIGENVTFGGGVTAGVQKPDVPPEEDGFPTICDGAVVLAHAVLVGPVRVGAYAQVGANSVLLSDAPDCAVMFGVPARRIANRRPVIPGSYADMSDQLGLESPQDGV
jgi:serine O-acetyltransferase